MKPSIKAVIVLFVILLLGIGIGFEIGEILFRKHFEEMEAFRGPQGFVNKFDDIIKPDAAQKPVVDSILLAFHNRIDKFGEAMRAQLDRQVDSLQIEMKPILTAEQFKRLTDEFKKIKNPPKHGDMPHGPEGIPPGAPPHGDGPHGDGHPGEPPDGMPPSGR
jgi:hypothetical protein